MFQMIDKTPLKKNIKNKLIAEGGIDDFASRHPQTLEGKRKPTLIAEGAKQPETVGDRYLKKNKYLKKDA